MSNPPQFPGDPQSPSGSANGDPYGQPQFGAASPADGSSPSYGNAPYGSSPYGSSPYGGPPYAPSANTAGEFVPAPGPGQFMGEPPRKKRGWIWFVVGCGILLLLGLLGLGGCVVLVATSSDGDGVRSGDPVTTALTEETELEEGEGEPAGTEPAASDAEEAPAGAVGTTRDNPAQPGTDAVEISTEGGTMAVTLGNVDWDADAKIAEANMFNEEAPEGEVYILLPVTVKYTGPDSITPWLELTVSYIAADGRSYDEASVVVENDFLDVGDLYDGGTAEGQMAFLIPEDAVGAGVFSVEAFLSWDTYFVAAV